MNDKVCLHCTIAFQTKDNRSRFCSRACSASYNNARRTVSQETKDRIRSALKQRAADFGPPTTREESFENAIAHTRGKFRPEAPHSILELSKRTAAKILHRLNVGCSRCGWSKASCDLHHIITKKNGGSDAHDNLCLLCPNCHREAHTGQIPLNSLIRLSDFINKEWADHYYG